MAYVGYNFIIFIYYIFIIIIFILCINNDYLIIICIYNKTINYE